MPLESGADTTEANKSPVCLLVLCGLPGAAKTTLARLVSQQARDDGVEVRHVCFDEHGCQPVGDQTAAGSRDSDGGGGFNPEEWRAARSRAFAQLESELCLSPVQQRWRQSETSGEDGQQQTKHTQADCCTGPAGSARLASSSRHPRLRLVIADDNMQYRSMRAQCYSLARAARAAIVLLYVRCSLEAALARNEARPAAQRVPPAVISRMASAFEEPGFMSDEAAGWSHSEVVGSASSGPPTLRTGSWEQSSLLTWNSTEGGLSPDTAAHLWQLIWQRWGPPAPPPFDAAAEAERVAAAQAATAASLAHAADLATRQVLSQQMRSLPVTFTQQQRVAAAQRLQAERRKVLAEAQRAATAAEGGHAGALHAHDWAALFRRCCEQVLAELGAPQAPAEK